MSRCAFLAGPCANGRTRARFDICGRQGKTHAQNLKLLSHKGVLFSVRCRAAGQEHCDIIWFKNDLRLHDHPGIEAAQSSTCVQPVYILDPYRVTQKLREPNGVEGLVGACAALDRELRQKGSRLLVLKGAAPTAFAELSSALNSRRIITEDEVEYGARRELQEVRENLQPTVELNTWSTPLYDVATYGDDFRAFKKRRGAGNKPLAEAGSLPSPAPESLLPSSLKEEPISFDTWFNSIQEADNNQLSPEVRQASADISEGWGASNTNTVREIAAGGEAQALSTLQQYLQSGRGQADGSDMSKAIDLTETRATPLGSFPAIFSQAIALGTLSRRRVYDEAQKMLSQSGSGSNSNPAQAASITAEAADFHWHLARSDGLREAQVATSPRHWRWRGFLTDYYTADPQEFGQDSPDPDQPAFLLVHGFGAFGSQWRGQIKALAKQGHLVFAPTLPGYGRAEKPSLPYSQQLWVDFLRDFVVEIIRRPVLVVGNSIGGFMSASLAADYPGLVKGLVLMNSAGLLQEKYKPPASKRDESTAMGQLMSGPPAFLVDGITSALLFYLEKTIGRTLKRAYPVNPSMADAWLTEEIGRAAGDLGAKQVFRSVFYLPKPRPLNYLVAELFQGPTLILQGEKDPLQNAPRRAKEMKRLCRNVEVVLVSAGHCPFDEDPEFCNRELMKFMNGLPRAKPAPASELSLA